MTAVELTTLRAQWPAEYRDGARCAFLIRFDGEREGAAIRAASTGGRLSAAMPGSRASTSASTTGFALLKRQRSDVSA